LHKREKTGYLNTKVMKNFIAVCTLAVVAFISATQIRLHNGDMGFRAPSTVSETAKKLNFPHTKKCNVTNIHLFSR